MEQASHGLRVTPSAQNEREKVLKKVPQQHVLAPMGSLWPLHHPTLRLLLLQAQQCLLCKHKQCVQHLVLRAQQHLLCACKHLHHQEVTFTCHNLSSILATWSRSGEVPLYYQGRPEEEDYYYDYSDEYYHGYPEYRSLGYSVGACFDAFKLVLNLCYSSGV